MKVFLILLLFLSSAANAEQSEFVSKIMQKTELEMSIFSYDDIHLHANTGDTLSYLGNCEKVDWDNWNWKCEGKKTYLIASKHGSIARFRVIEKMSLAEMTKVAGKISAIYGPANIVKRSATRPFDLHNHSDKVPLRDNHWDASEPIFYTWYEKDRPECCMRINAFEGKELTIKHLFGEMYLTVSDPDIEFYEEQETIDPDKLILSNKTSVMTGIYAALKGLAFLLVVLLYRGSITEEKKDMTNQSRWSLLITRLGSGLGVTAVMMVFGGPLIFGFFKLFFGMDAWGSVVFLACGLLVGLYLRHKQI